MRARQDELGDSEIVVVTFANPRVLRGYRKRFADPFTVVSDVQRETYRALGFGRGAFWRVWGWKAAKKYVELLRSGHKLEKGNSETDTRQLGGNAVLDREGRLAWIYAGAGPDDRPTVDELIDVVRSLPGAGT